MVYVVRNGALYINDGGLWSGEGKECESECVYVCESVRGRLVGVKSMSRELAGCYFHHCPLDEWNEGAFLVSIPFYTVSSSVPL